MRLEVNRAMLLERANAATNISAPPINLPRLHLWKLQTFSTANQPAAAVEPAKTEAGNQAINSSAAAVPKHGTYEKARDQFASRFKRHARSLGRQRKAGREDSPRFLRDVRGSFLRSQPALCAGGPRLFVVFLVLLLLSKVMG